MFAKELIAMSCVGLFAAGTALAAAPFSSAIVPGGNTISDDDAEVVLKYVDDGLGAYHYRAFNPLTDKIQTNDILVGIVGITSFPTGALGTSASLYNQITGVYAVQAISSAPATPISCGKSTLTTCTSYEFGAATLASATDPLNGAIALLNANYGTTLGLFANTTVNSFASIQEDSPDDFIRSPTDFNTAYGSAADGTQRFVWDIDAANSDYFVTTAPADVLQLGLVPFGANAGSFGGQGTISYQDVPGWEFAPAVTITGNIRAGDGEPFRIWTDSTYELNAKPLPEPGTVVLLGLGLLGLGASSRVRKNRAA